MQSVDIHAHMLSSRVSFKRLYDKVAISFFAKTLGTCSEALRKDPYGEYQRTFIRNIANSKHVERMALYPVDAKYDEKGNVVHFDPTVCASNEDVLGMYEDYPEYIIPFSSVNPLRLDSIDAMAESIERGCKGVKFLQNYWEVDANDARFRDYYELLAKKNIPLTIHTGSESSVPSTSQYEKSAMLRLPLECGVTVIAAHLGLGSYEDHRTKPWRMFSKNPAYFNKDYFDVLEMMEKWPNLYGDVSAFLTPMRAKALPHLKKQTHIHDKLLFGTDFPVPTSTVLTTYDLPFLERYRLRNEKNPLDRYVQAFLHYFPEESPLWNNWQKVIV